MKIAFINIYQNKVYRGAETFVSELAKRLSGKYEVDILTSANLLTIWKEKYDVVIPINGRFQAFLARFITWLYGGRVVISGQSGIGFDDRLNLYSFPDRFIALTDFQLQWARKINPFIKIFKIPNGVDIKIFTGRNNNSKVKTIVSVGAFTNEKRHDLTIKAVSRLEDQNVNLVIVGGGGNIKKNLEALGNKLLGDRFEILSVVHDRMSGIYKKASVLAFPSVPWESFGIAIVEAMASGLPVVATNDPIRREIVGDAGILVDPTDITLYAKALKEALNKDWDDKPRIQAEKFDWDGIAEQYERLFESLYQ